MSRTTSPISEPIETSATTTAAIPIDKVLPNPEQPRRVFDADRIGDLARSISENGLISPILVEREAKAFILVDGERRWRAAKLLKWTHIEAVVREASDHPGQNTGTNGHGHDRLIRALVANVQRIDLGPIEQARAFGALRQELGSAKAVARKLGLPHGGVILRLALLKMAEPVQQMFESGQLPMDPTMIWRLAKLPKDEQARVSAESIAHGWHAKEITRAVEQRLKTKHKAPTSKGNRPAAERDVAEHFDALAMIGDCQDLPARVVRTVRKTCQACSLYPRASQTVCKRCPLPDFLVLYRTDDGDDE